MIMFVNLPTCLCLFCQSPSCKNIAAHRECGDRMESRRVPSWIFKRIIDKINDSIIIISPEKDIVYANEHFLKMVEMKREEVIGKKCYKVLHGSESPCEEIECPIDSKKDVSIVVHCHKKRDGDIYVEIFSFPIENIGYVEVLRDITKEKIYEESLKRSLEEIRLLYYLLRIITSTLNINDILNKTLEEVVKIMDADCGAVRIFRDGEAEISARYNYPEELFKKVKKMPINTCAHALAIKEGKSIVSTVDECPAPDDIKNLAKKYGIKKVISTPIFSKDRIIGAITLLYKKDIKVTKERLELFKHVGEIVGIALENAFLCNNLRKYAEKAEEKSRMKELFLDILRHDLLNPLGIVKNIAEFLPDSEEKIIIKRNIKKAIEIIENSAKLAKIENMKEISIEEIDIGKLIEDVIKDLLPYANEKNIKIEYKYRKTIAKANKELLREVFMNLIDNAIKYSPENNTVIVDIRDEKDYVVVAVKDYGIGVPDEFKEVIFDRFKRLSKKGIKGTGLGLTIVKKIVELHNGKVWVEDNEPCGSIFYVKIPKDIVRPIKRDIYDY